MSNSSMQQKLATPTLPETVQRVHRNIAYQPHVLNQYEEDATICKKVIYYLQNKFDRDLFGAMSLDPHEFVKETGINRSILAKNHPAPYQQRINKFTPTQIQELRSNGDLLETVLENAIYRIAHQRIEYTVLNDLDPENIHKVSKFFDFFDGIRVMINRKNRNKKLYYIKPSLSFSKTLKQYTLVNPKKYFELSKGKSNQVADLYIYLNYVKQTLIYKNQPAFPAHKNLLIKILNCPEFTRDRKKNEIIDRHFKEIQTSDPKLGLRFEWKPNLNNPQYKDYCLISFTNLESTKDWMLDSQKREQRTEHYFDHHLYYRLVLAMNDTHGNIDMADLQFRELFSEWIDSPKDINVKLEAYQDTYQDLWEDKCPEKYATFYFTHFKHLSGEFSKRTF